LAKRHRRLAALLGFCIFQVEKKTYKSKSIH
jgi:hypothetical protein